jgi:hypothetical protein
MEKVEERKKISNLEMTKLKGIMCSNPFSVLPIHESDDRAHIFGSSINEVEIENDLSHNVAGSSPSMPPLDEDERQEELETHRTEVTRESRGKHPRKQCQ